MGRQKRRRFRINDDTMTTIVVWSLLFCVVVVVTGMVLACFGVDVSTIVGSALVLFGTELGVCGIMTIFNRQAERQDKIAEKRLESRMRREEIKNERERNERSTK